MMSFIADTLGIGFGDKADAQHMRTEALEALDGQPGHANAVQQDSAHGVRVQRRVADPAAGADAAEQRAGLALGDRLPRLEGAQRAGFGVFAARQADFGPCPAWSVLPRAIHRRSPPANGNIPEDQATVRPSCAESRRRSAGRQAK